MVALQEQGINCVLSYWDLEAFPPLVKTLLLLPGSRSTAFPCQHSQMQRAASTKTLPIWPTPSDCSVLGHQSWAMSAHLGKTLNGHFPSTAPCSTARDCLGGWTQFSFPLCVDLIPGPPFPSQNMSSNIFSHRNNIVGLPLCFTFLVAAGWVSILVPLVLQENFAFPP